jgi:hypothetical protein
MANINPIEDIFAIKEDMNPQSNRIYTEEEEAQNIEDDKLMADTAGWEYERSHHFKNYDNLADMLADGVDIDDIPESCYTTGDRQQIAPKPLNKVETKIPRKEDIEYIPF